MTALLPMHDYVVIRRLPDTQIGRIHMPASVDTKPRIGIVEAVGPGLKLPDGQRMPMLTQVGDRVVFSLDSGFIVQMPGDTFEERLLVREGGLRRENGTREGGIVAILEEGEASALGSPWPSFITEGPQDRGES